MPYPRRSHVKQASYSFVKKRLIDGLIPAYYLRTLAWGALTRCYPDLFTVWMEDENEEGGYRMIQAMDRLPSNPEGEWERETIMTMIKRRIIISRTYAHPFKLILCGCRYICCYRSRGYLWHCHREYERAEGGHGLFECPWRLREWHDAAINMLVAIVLPHRFVFSALQNISSFFGGSNWSYWASEYVTTREAWAAIFS